MMRNISITINPSQQGSEYIHINNIGSIINYSCDSISIGCLEYLSEQDHPAVIANLLHKLRNNGKLIIQVSNSQSIAQNFLQKSVSNSEFLSFFANKRSLVSIETIYTLIDFNIFDLVDIEITSETIKTVLERKKYE